MRIRHVTIAAMGALLVALLAVTMAQAGAKKGKTVTIGWVGDKSGPFVSSQAPALHAFEAYFKMVNDAGGVNGDKINFVEKDDGGNVAKALEGTKSLIGDDHALLVTGFGNSSSQIPAIPVATAAKVPLLMTQSSIKALTDPFQPYVFEGICNMADQADVAIGFMLKKLNVKNLNGIKVGVAAISVASGQEWLDSIAARVAALGGSTVLEPLPTSIVNADVAVQAFLDAKVKYVFIHHSVSGAVALIRSMDKYNLNVPIGASAPVTQSIVYQSSPYNGAKYLTGGNCYSPPLYVKTAKGKLAYSIGKKYGYPQAEITQQAWSNGWVLAQVVTAAVKNMNGTYTPAAMKKGLESIKNLDTGDLSPKITLGPKCHMVIRGVRPYTYSFSKDAILPIGTYAQWSHYITNAFAAPGTCGRPRG